jgi:hypothetical protein
LIRGARGARAAHFTLALALALITSSGVVRATPSKATGDAPGDSAEVSQELEAGRFRFCSEESYRLFSEDKDAICPHLDSLIVPCKGLAHACRVQSWEDYLKEDEAVEEKPLLWRLFSGVGQFFGPVLEALFWLALAAGALLLLRTLLKTLSSRKEEPRAESERELDREAAAIPPESLSSAELLVRAELLWAEGARRAALHLCYGAAVRGLAERGVVAPQKSRTTGEYLRALRKLDASPTLAPQGFDPREASALLLELDRARFKSEPEATFLARILPRVRRLASLTQLAGLLLVFFVGCDQTSLPEAPNHPTGPRGFALAESLIRRHTGNLTKRVRQVTNLSANIPTIISLGANLRDLEWENLERYVDQGGHLIVIGPTPQMAHVFELEMEPLPCEHPPTFEGLTVRPLRVLEGLSGMAGDINLTSCGTFPFAAAHFHGRGLLTVIGDPALFENTSLITADNAQLALGLLGDLGSRVELLGPLTGRGALNPLQSISRSGLMPWLLHLLVLLGLFLWAKGKGFGRRIDAPLPKRRSFLLHAEALAATYRRRGALAQALSQYAELTAHLLLRRSEGGRDEARSLSSGVSHHPREALELRRAMTLARNAGQLGQTPPQLLTHFRELQRMNHRVLSEDTQGRRPTIVPKKITQEESKRK